MARYAVIAVSKLDENQEIEAFEAETPFEAYIKWSAPDDDAEEQEIRKWGKRRGLTGQGPHMEVQHDDIHSIAVIDLSYVEDKI